MDISAYQHMHLRMSTRGKRPLRNLTPTDKVRAIQRIHNGETKASVSRDIGVPESTLRGWCKNEQKIRFMCRQVGSSNEQMFINVAGLETPPEKRVRFESHLQTPKFPPLNHFDEFMFNHSPVGTLVFPSNNNNNIWENVTINDIAKKYSCSERLSENPIETQISAIISPATSSSNKEFSQLSVNHNLNLMSLLYPSVIVGNIPDLSNKIKSGYPVCMSNVGITESTTNRPQNLPCFRNSSKRNIRAPSLTVKNWAQDPYHVSTTPADIAFNEKQIANVWNNDMHTVEPCKENTVNFSCPLSLYSQKLQIADAANKATSDSTKSELSEWCKIFSASLSFLALTTAAAALQPNATPNESALRQIKDQFWKTITNIEARPVSPSKFLACLNSDLSSDSFCENEPEDLSLRSTTSSKFSSPAHISSQSHQICLSKISPIKNGIDY